jgi:hypothetical protein
MDFWFQPPGHGPADQVRRLGARAVALVGEPVTFGIAPDDVGGFLERHGFEVFDLVRSRELAARYSTDGRPTERSLYVLAARR